MQAAAAAAAAAEAEMQPTPPSVPRIALLPSVYDDLSSTSTSPGACEQPLIQYNGDTEMEDAPQDGYVSISFALSLLQQQLTLNLDQ